MNRALMGCRRIHKDLGCRGVPSVPMLGRYNYASAMPGLESHRHLGAIEICYLVRGRQTYEVGGKFFNMRGGDVFLTFPNEAHGTGGELQEKGLLYWFALRDPIHTEGSLLGLPPRDSLVLWAALRRLPRRHFPGCSEMKSHFDAITELTKQRSSTLTRIAITNHFIALLLAILAVQKNASLRGKGQRFSSVFAWIEARLESPDELTVERLAEVAGLSCSRFQALFKQENGIPPAEFALRARIAEARRRLMQSDTDVTSVAFDLGFSSSQYFASAFRRFTNTSPSGVLRRKTEGRKPPTVRPALS